MAGTEIDSAPPDVPALMAEAMAVVAEGLAPIREMVRGYRTLLEEDGFSPTMSEAMAAQLHVELVAMVFRQVSS